MRNRGLKNLKRLKKKKRKKKRKNNHTTISTTTKKNDRKNSKDISGHFSGVWAVLGHFQGGSLCLTSSVCWSLQFLISTLSQGGRWWTLCFFF